MSKKSDQLLATFVRAGYKYSNGFFINVNSEVSKCPLIVEEDMIRLIQNNGIFNSADTQSIIASLMLYKTDVNIRELHNKMLASRAKSDLVPNKLYEALFDSKTESLIRSMIASKIEYFILLHGRAGAGKSLILRILEKIYTKYFKVSTIRQFNSDFGGAVLSGALLIMADDLKTENLTKVGDTIKTTVTGGSIQINQKYKPQVTIKSAANLIFACNNLPLISLDDDGLLRRLQIINFDKPLDTSIFEDDDSILESMLDECATYLISTATKATRQELQQLNRESLNFYIKDNIVATTSSYFTYKCICENTNKKPLSEENYTKARENIKNMTDLMEIK